MNYYAVCDQKTNSVVYIGTRENCEQFRREQKCKNHTEIWHVHDIQVQESNLT